MYSVVEYSYNVVRSWANVNPFTLAFCRTKDYGNILFKGGLLDFKRISTDLGPSLVSTRLFYRGVSRGYEELLNCDVDGKGLYWMKKIDYNGSGLDDYSLRLNRKRVVRLVILFSNPVQTLLEYRRMPSTFPYALCKYLDAV